MGGSAHKGNITPTAEFNFHCDPEAAHLVLKKVRLCMCAPISLRILARQRNTDVTILAIYVFVRRLIQIKDLNKQASLLGQS